jgi:aspartyl protease family protein
MAGAAGIGIILLAAAVLLALYGEREVAGLTPDELASVLSLGSLALLISSYVFREFQGRWTRGVQAILVWAALFIALAGVYSFRFDIQDAALRLAGELAPGRVTTTSTGEVVTVRRADGSFILAGRANDRNLNFVFDTGASTVVLTAESARALGIQPADRDYTVAVSTANGRTTAAPVWLDSIGFGPIVEPRVRALVARPGVLRENLLGMTFLERLTSFEVRQNRLILRGRNS